MKANKYIIAMLVVLIFGMHPSYSQTTKKKPATKPKKEQVVKAKNDSTAAIAAGDTLNNSPIKTADKKAKDKSEKKDVKDEEVELSRPYQPTLSEGYKISNSPQIEQAKLDVPKMDYSVTPKSFPTWYNVLPINPAKMREEKQESLMGNSVKLGYGNYDNAYGEVFLNTNRNKEYSIGAHLKHFSSTGHVTDYPNSQFSDNLIDIYGKRYLEHETISGDLSYRRNVVHYITITDTGMHLDPLIPAPSKQIFSLFQAQAGFQSNFEDKKNLSHEINLNYYSLTDNFNCKESGFSLNGLLKKNLEKETALQAEILVDNNSFKQDTAAGKSNTIIGFAPQYVLKQGNIDIALGINAELESEAKTSFHLYPKIDFSFSFADESLKIYAIITGESVKNTFRTTTTDNPFINTKLAELENSNNKKDVCLGIKGSLSNTMSFNLRGGYKEVANIPLFTNYSIGDIPQNNFLVMYDAAKVINAHLELSYQKNESLRIILCGDYNHYTLNTQLYAWLKPAFRTDLTAIYNTDKFTFKGDVFSLMGLKANPGFMFVNNAPTSIDLKTIVDVNIGAAYHYTKSLAFFLNLNNLANSQYQIWYQYPMQRFNLLGGFSYTF